MVLFARNLAFIDSLLGDPGAAAEWKAEADSLSARINALMWDEVLGFYYDLTPGNTPVRVKTIAAFWTLLGGVATSGQAARLASQLRNPATFGRIHPVPSCSADEPGYVGRGGYWRGAVWPSTNTMVIRGLERYGFHDLARDIALKHVAAVADVFRASGTIWENYAPDAVAPGAHVDGTPVVRDMVGWSGIGPLLYFMEFAVGLVPDAPANRLVWTIRSSRPSGCARYRFNGHVVTLMANPGSRAGDVRVDVDSDGDFTLIVTYRGTTRTVELSRGRSTIDIG
jgi:glycogen debranching enzyme